MEKRTKKETIKTREFVICSIVASIKRLLYKALTWFGSESLDVSIVRTRSWSPNGRRHDVMIHPSSWPEHAAIYLRIESRDKGRSWQAIEGYVHHPTLETRGCGSMSFRFQCSCMPDVRLDLAHWVCKNEQIRHAVFIATR